ncbi:MAG: hypothetical protein AMS27_02790 [Bacteroides sp. SM23_62_1]|nr:MAG: hypothetical protein AMS27_02790 [Bacteroides sp. SM23_62_1]
MTDFFDTWYFDYLILPLLIFLARIIDVSMDTIRMIFIARGFKKFAPIIGFFQVLVWIITITRIMANLENWTCYIAYAAGFAAGNLTGMIIEERLALGIELIRVVTRRQAGQLITALKDHNFPVTSVDATGVYGNVAVLFIVVKRKQMKEVLDLIRKYNPRAFYTVEDIRFVSKTLPYDANEKAEMERSLLQE